MQKKIILIFSLLLTFTAFGQRALKKLNKTKNRFDLLTMQKKYDEQINFFYQPFINLVGGKDSLLKKLKRQDSLYNAQDYLITSEGFDIPKIDKISGDTIRAIIKHLTGFYEKGQKFYMQKYYVGISTDKGKKWFFVDTSFCKEYDLDLKLLFPDLTSIRDIFIIPTKKLINQKNK